MRIYFEFLGWFLRKALFGIPEIYADLMEKYRYNLIHNFGLSIFLTCVAWMLLGFFTMICCAIAQVTKQEFYNCEFYLAGAVWGFAIYHWLAAWFDEFLQEREDIIERLKR